MSATWTERVVALIADGKGGASAFAKMTEDEITSSPFFGMLEDLWNQSQRETKQTAKKHVLSEEEKAELIKTRQSEYVANLGVKSSAGLLKLVAEKYPHLKEAENLTKKMTLLGFDVLMGELEKLNTSGITATKTLASGRVVGNHNNYHREEGELLKGADGKKVEVEVEFKSGMEVCGIIPTRDVAKGYTFEELKSYKSVERAEKGYSQVFVKPMIFSKDPRHIKGLCGCANGINKKLNKDAMCETITDEGVKRYSPSKLTFTPTFACNGKITANGRCKAHNNVVAKGKSVAKWTPEMMGDWKVVEYNL